MIPKKSTAKYIINKISKVKDMERILEATREKQFVIYKKRNPTKEPVDFSAEMLQVKEVA